MTGGELFERIQKRGDSPFTERGRCFCLTIQNTTIKNKKQKTKNVIITLNLLLNPNKV